MEHNVVTLETAKKLKAAGYPQDASFNAWFPSYDAPAAAPELTKDDGSPIGYYLYEANFNDLGSYAAPTAQELADQLPKSDTSEWGRAYPTSPVVWIQEGKCYAAYKSEMAGIHNDDELWNVMANTMAEALASLYLRLQEGK